jgi:hypothetical protein
MRGVGHELPLLHHRCAKPIQQFVERRRQPAEFVSRIGDRQPPVNATYADAPCLISHGHHRRQALPRQEPSPQPRNQQPHRDHPRQDFP